MKYYKFNRVLDKEGLLHSVRIEPNLEPGKERKVQMYITPDDKDCVIAVESDDAFVDGIKGQDAEIKLTEIKEDEFKSLREKARNWNLIWEGIKNDRDRALSVATVDLNKIILDADEKSMDRIDRILTVASARFNQLLGAGKTAQEAYKEIYKNTKLAWKTNENKFHEFTIEDFITIQDAALKNMQAKWHEFS